MIWQLGKQIALQIYSLTKAFPRTETFVMITQMRRAAVSISSNIAEGFTRSHNNEHRQFLYVALASCAELETQTEICHEIGYISKDQYSQLVEILNHESRMIRNALKRFTQT